MKAKNSPLPRYAAKPSHIIAYCWADGVIDFTRTNQKRTPPHALPIVAGPARAVREAVGARARIAYDGRTLLVPGIPEARALGYDPVKKLREFGAWVRQSKKWGSNLYDALPAR